MTTCNVCGNNHSRFLMNNKLVCMKCDELLFDIEIECEEEGATKTTDRTKPTTAKEERVLQLVVGKKE